MKPFQPSVYGALRVVHLVVTAAVMPLGVLRFLQLGDAPSGGVRFAVFAVGSVLALFVISMDQADYPATSLGALRRTGPLLVNLGVGLWNADGSVLPAAHWTLTSLLASLAGSLALITVLALRSDDPDLRKNRNLIYGLVIPLSLAAGALTFVVGWPLAKGLTPSVPTLLASLAWLGQTVATTRAWMRQSVFSNYAQTEDGRARTAAMAPWNGLAALAMAGVMASLAFVLIFTLG